MNREHLQTHWDQIQFTRKRQLAFLEDLNSLIEDGVPASQAIDTLRQITQGINKIVATQIALHLSQGHSIAEGMQLFFVRPIVEIIRSGEASGTLPSALQSAIKSLSVQTDSWAVLVNSLLYPVVVLIMALGVIVFVKNSVLEDFARLKPISSWPSIGRQLYDVAFTTEYGWWLILLLLIGITVGLVYLLKRYTGQFRSMIDRWPVLSLYRTMTAARFMETLGLLVSNGVAVKKALTIMHRDASPYLSWHILRMEHRLGGGKENMADVLDTHLISQNDLVRLRVVAKGKGFAQALTNLGRQAQQRNANIIRMVSKLMGGVLLALSAFLAMMMVLGIYSIGSIIA